MVRVTGGCHVIWIYDVTGVRWLLEAYPCYPSYVSETQDPGSRAAPAESSRSLDRVTDA